MESNNSDASSFACDRSWEVEDFSPPSSPEVERKDGAAEADSGPQPYQFEPLARELAGATGGADAAEAAEAAERHRMGPVSEWCTCGHCTSLSPRENMCCRETPKVGVDTCITQHPGFEPVALNPYVLKQCRPHTDYRHLAYRNFVRWCWGIWGTRTLVYVVGTVIRSEFPEDGSYTGFLPPLDFD
uniref:P2X purinoreceptor 7 intracellular domain-containing protein n=1 Tax=Neogobius melanostomus TaxID=47308 RepID=A0A8C6TKG6_9GOBI